MHGIRILIPVALSLLCNAILSGQPVEPGEPARLDPDKTIELPIQGNHVYLSRYQDLGDGRLHRAVQEIGSAPAVLFLDIDDAMGGGLEIPANIDIVHMGGAVLDLNGHDLIVRGAFMAGYSQVFSGDGAIAFERGALSQVLPQWWGANNSDSVQKALDAATACGAELFLCAGTYEFDDPVKHSYPGPGFRAPALTIRGAGPGNTIIDNRSAAMPAFHFDTVSPATDTGLFLNIEGIEITSTTGSGSHGIQVEDVWLGRISNCFIHDQSGDGILMRADNLDLGLPKTWRIERTLLFENGGYGIHFESPNDISAACNIVMDQLDVELNRAGGVYAAAELTKITNSIFAYNGTGAILNLIVFQPPAEAFAISFDPIFKTTGGFSVSALHYSSIRFLYTGLYWIQLGAPAIDMPL